MFGIVSWKLNQVLNDIKDLGATKKILFMEIHRDKQSRKVYLSQKIYGEGTWMVWYAII